jgi:MHS family proline/betaine transporter-like MFS transporter
MPAQVNATRRVIAASTIGNALEWYDFAIYGLMAPIVGKLFFPSDDPVASLLAAFGVFALGYAARPVGGLVLGHIGDRYGRKRALILSIGLMGATTFAIGILPDYDRIGTSAAVLLVVLRLVQGFSVGGEFPGSMVYLAEHAPDGRRGFFVGWTQVGCLTGFLLGSGLGALAATVLGETAMAEWGWRVPFLLGAPIALIGYAFRRRLPEPPGIVLFAKSKGLPVVAAVRDHWRALLRIVAISIAGTVGFYLAFVYAASYLTQHMHETTARALDIETLALIVMLALALPAGLLSDRIGRKPLLLVAAIGLLLLAWPLWWLIHQEAFALVLAGQIGFALLMGLIATPGTAAFVEMLPAQVRVSGVALGYNAAIGLIGGTTPLVVTYLVERTADDFTPAYYLMAATVIQIVAILGMRETAKRPLG